MLYQLSYASMSSRRQGGTRQNEAALYGSPATASTRAPTRTLLPFASFRPRFVRATVAALTRSVAVMKEMKRSKLAPARVSANAHLMGASMSSQAACPPFAPLWKPPPGGLKTRAWTPLGSSWSASHQEGSWSRTLWRNGRSQAGLEPFRGPTCLSREAALPGKRAYQSLRPTKDRKSVGEG